MLRRALHALLLGLCGAVGACGGGSGSPTSPSGGNGYAGQWRGTTLQGTTVTFTVSPDQMVTTLSMDYTFGSCSGKLSFPGLALPIAAPKPQPGGPPPRPPFDNPSFGYGESKGEESVLQILGAFTSDQAATGTMSLVNYAGCPFASTNWNATKR